MLCDYPFSYWLHTGEKPYQTVFFSLIKSKEQNKQELSSALT